MTNHHHSDDETTPLVAFGSASKKEDKRNENDWFRYSLLTSPLIILFCSSLIFFTGIYFGQGLNRHDGSPNAAFILRDVLSPPPPVTSYYDQEQNHLMYPKVGKHDFGPLKEYSVIHSDRSLNLMSEPFQQVMRNLNQLLKVTYHADKVAIIPGSGTFGMEAVARQFATGEHVLVIRNGYFSYRWTQIFNFSQPTIPSSHTVLKAQPVTTTTTSYRNTSRLQQYAPPPIDSVIQRIEQEKPAVVFAPHVETSTGIMLPDEYICRLSTAVHSAAGGLLVLDGIASGTVWIDMDRLGVDVLIAAPQKDWTSPPSSALVMLSKRAVQRIDPTRETSFSLSLQQWLVVMDAYENGEWAYHTTPPTDALRQFQRVSVEMLEFGLPQLKEALTELGQKARNLLASRGLTSVAAPGFEAPGVLVYYSPQQGIDNPIMVQRFQEQGLQIAKGVPWMIDEPDNVKSFRIGLFGLDKLLQEQPTIDTLQVALDHVLAETSEEDVG